jgi:hypothetical protein
MNISTCRVQFFQAASLDRRQAGLAALTHESACPTCARWHVVAAVADRGRRQRRRLQSGGVAERLIAPVLKTGRPKGLVSSNLTPSAFLTLSVLEDANCSESHRQAAILIRARSRIADSPKKKMRDEHGAKKPQHCGADNVGKVMRTKVHSREPDQNRDWQTGQANTAACKNQDTKKRGGCSDVTRRKGVIFRAETRAAPAQLRFHGRAGPWNGALDDGADNACDRHRQYH